VWPRLSVAQPRHACVVLYCGVSAAYFFHRRIWMRDYHLPYMRTHPPSRPRIHYPSISTSVVVVVTSSRERPVDCFWRISTSCYFEKSMISFQRGFLIISAITDVPFDCARTLCAFFPCAIFRPSRNRRRLYLAPFCNMRSTRARLTVGLRTRLERTLAAHRTFHILPLLSPTPPTLRNAINACRSRTSRLVCSIPPLLPCSSPPISSLDGCCYRHFFGLFSCWLTYAFQDTGDFSLLVC